MEAKHGAVVDASLRVHGRPTPTAGITIGEKWADMIRAAC
jgi:hypothetical protein